MRRFLRDTHVGAVTIGFLLFYAVQSIIYSIENPYLMWLRRKTQPVLMQSQPVQYFDKPLLYRTLGEALLYLFFAVVLIGIVYTGKQPKEAAAQAPEPAAKS